MQEDEWNRSGYISNHHNEKQPLENAYKANLTLRNRMIWVKIIQVVLNPDIDIHAYSVNDSSFFILKEMIDIFRKVKEDISALE